ncbi:SLAP domain-containing protein [Lactobacillus sp. PV034]|uniref:SLAP domain-containing protein n=1 Tax=Lactobacillus sp. PV034 TaxID=2594495 RepID=UPI00223EA4C6|nr:SLAP domain-containing protein [Lactobacillus sp. PV034]QNQ81223.1 hypothetical protein FP432_06495 [Lactobacillus sp. PV034]
MKIQKSLALSAGICALALTAVSTSTAHAADTTTTSATTTQQQTNVFQAKAETVKINYNANFGIAVWSSPTGSTTGKFVSGQTTVKVSGSQVVNGKTWYLLADNSGWIDGQYASPVTTSATTTSETKTSQKETTSSTTSKTDTKKTTSEKATTKSEAAKVTSVSEVVTVGDNGAPIYSDTNTAAKTARTLTKGSRWQAFSRIEANNQVWYNLGGKQYVLASDLVGKTSSTSTPATTTTKKDTKKSDTETSTKVINTTVKITSQKGAVVYTKPDSAAKTSRILADNSQWKAFKTADNNALWINLGGNQWILASDTNYSTSSTTNTKPAKTTTTSSTTTSNVTGTLRINYRPGYGIAVWSQPANNIISGKYLKTGSAWKFFGTTNVNGHTWYNLGGNQWIDGQYAKVTAATKPANDDITQMAFSFATVNYKPGYGIASWSAPNGHVTGKYFKTGTFLNVLAITDDHQWTKVTDVVSDQTGWVQTKYLKAQFINQ